ncbi:MAG: hypothetical protein E7579_08335 [Ruminococcaceae bacterium]|nr:hypothetical protein [Oscillospiraceae bacterium]
MIEWWNNMDLVGQIFALIAIPSTLVLVVQTILLLCGIGGDDIDTDGVDITGNGVGDTPGDGGGDGMVLFSLRGIMAMAAVGGWSGLVMYEAGINIAVTVLLAVAFGFMALVGIAYLMKLAMKLQQNGTLDLGYAIGKVGTVYIPIPAEMKGSGKINLAMQERFIEVDAMTSAGRKLVTGESVRVTATNENGMVVVEPLS